MSERNLMLDVRCLVVMVKYSCDHHLPPSPGAQTLPPQQEKPQKETRHSCAASVVPHYLTAPCPLTYCNLTAQEGESYRRKGRKC